MVPDLSCIVENARLGGVPRRFLDDRFKVQPGEIGSFKQLVGVVHVGFVVLVVVELQGPGADVGFQSILRIGQIG